MFDIDIKAAISRAAGADAVIFDAPMKDYTSFGIGGPADALVEATCEETVRSTMQTCREHGIPYIVLGNGSNVLIRDGGVRACVIRMDGRFAQITRTGDDTVYATAGTQTRDFAHQCALWGLAGAEFLSGIPGTIGGTTAMNAGAFTGDVFSIAIRVRAVDRQGDIVDLQNEDMGFSYRHSLALEKNITVLGTEYRLRKGDTSEILERIEDLNGRRRKNQPLEYPSAGSMFKRPEGHYAAKLIDDAGLKGYSVGGGQVSQKHAGFVVNKGGATSADIEKLVENVKTVVMDKFGVKLETEVRFIGVR